MHKQLIECVPNISEGRDIAKIKEIAHIVETIDGVRLLDIDPGKAANRTVITFVGKPEAVIKAAFKLMKKASELIDMSKDLFIQGFRNGVDSTDILIESKDVQLFLSTFFRKKQQQKQQEQFAEVKNAGEAFLAENKSKEGVQTTASGLQYIVMKEGTGEKPVAASKVKVHYHGTSLDGKVFDSSVDKGKPSEFFANQVIKGWTEGLQLMNVGSKYKFFIPQELAYGVQARGEGIKPFSTLVFEIELLDIVKK